MLKGTVEKRVRYAETDKMGFLYYGHYAQLYEIGRVELIRDLGITYRLLEDVDKIMMPVLELNCRYRLPARYDDLLTIQTELRERPTKMIQFFHEIYNQNGQLLNSGWVKLFFIDMVTNKRISCPSILTDKIRKYF